jgi:hypothetical protein
VKFIGDELFWRYQEVFLSQYALTVLLKNVWNSKIELESKKVMHTAVLFPAAYPRNVDLYAKMEGDRTRKINIQGVPGGMCQTSGVCSLC